MTTDLTTFKERLAVLQTLNDDFGIPNYLEFKAGRDGLPIAEITNDHAVATIALSGGHLMTFRPRDQEQVLWLSKLASLEATKPIRGGIPICWPWFGPHYTDSHKPAHGFARQGLWKVIETTRLGNGNTQISLELLNTPTTQSLWSYPTRLQLRIIVGIDLQVELITHNLSKESFMLGEAFHTYFNISDITKITIYGLKGCEYIDKVEGAKRKKQEGAVKIRSETDRIYLNTTTECIIEDPGLKRRIRIAKEGSQATVVWNPWEEKAAKLEDCGYQGFLTMVCVETANAAENVVAVQPGEAHTLKAIISSETF